MRRALLILLAAMIFLAPATAHAVPIKNFKIPTDGNAVWVHQTSGLVCPRMSDMRAVLHEYLSPVRGWQWVAERMGCYDRTVDIADPRTNVVTFVARPSDLEIREVTIVGESIGGDMRPRIETGYIFVRLTDERNGKEAS